uniref:Uncharacterized protein n=1 Tax=Chrysemys picta bellii TaxID=8478 RepID=A0A8C3FZ06_CHRPI
GAVDLKIFVELHKDIKEGKHREWGTLDSHFTLCTSVSCRLHSCSLTAACCGDLSCVLSTSQVLTELDREGNKLGESGDCPTHGVTSLRILV